MSEPWPDQLSRLRQMADPKSKWDLSPNDQAAIRAALDALTWVSVTERLPEKFVHVLTWTSAGECFFG